MLKIENDYYRKNRLKLYNDYQGKFIVIKGNKVIGSYDSHEDARRDTTQVHPVGTFIIKAMIEPINIFQ